ncbi:MAG: T9SS type A sorting domain-containing protein [Saprospiraceae bacterium]|nr:T9SS type A sorting domain-containing protein [Saprospiraceae bacterium]
MKQLSILSLLFIGALFVASPLYSQGPAPDFTVTTSDGQVKKLYQDYINQQKLVVIEAFFTTCPPCATHAPLVQNLYTSMQAAHPGQIEFILLSTLFSDTNVKVAQYKTSKGLTMPGVGNNGGSITALQPYLNGLYGQFQGTPTFIVIAPGTGEVFFDIRGNSPSQTIALLQQKIESLFPKECSLENPFGSPLEEVQITVDAPAFDTSFFANDTYDLSQVAALQNTDYTLKPKKTGSPYDGLTTYDLVLISKHILDIVPFHCPWQIVAADVNHSESITTFDIVTARKVILGITDTFPNGSWRFLPDSATISNGNCQDFVGVKLGDVNAGPCNDSLASPADSRSLPQNLFFRERAFQPGESARVALFFMENNELDGLQCSFDFDPNFLKINTVETAILEDFDAESYHLGYDHLSFSWLQPQGQRLTAGTAVLRLDLTAPQGGRLSDLLRFSGTGLAPEAYGSDGKIHPLHLSVLPALSNYFISPNPAEGHFSIQSTMENEGFCLIQMLDVQGKIVFEKTFPAIKGINRWEIETSGAAAGLYFLKVNGEAAGKVVIK